ncbi:MAG TPA: peptidylprolyl isomerase [Acidimicrobiales bacterium]|jgi:cyclophilin family peptidyl-prolyl cis-trans isomerase|nr:peptidylprolyl isomerase [Acidimicrobiales bacterium]
MATSKRERQKAARREKLEREQRYEKRRKNIRRGVIVGVIAVIVVGSGALLFTGGKPKAKASTTTTTSTTAPATTTTTAKPAGFTVTQAQANAKAVAAGCPASTSTRVNTKTWPKAPAMTINTAKTYYAHFTTTAGNFVVKLDASTAPITTNNFVFLADQGYYKCVIFHRVISGFMIQGGDPTGTGTGGPGYTIPDEYPKAATPDYPLYSIAMANTGAANTGGSQFFIVTGASGESLPNTYSLFGQVVSGVKAVNTIQNAGSTSSTGVPPAITHRILNITITES